MTMDEFLNALAPQLQHQSMMAIHELFPAAVPEFEDELGVTVCLEISERARLIAEARQGVANFQSSFLLRHGAKDRKARLETTRDRALDELNRFLTHRAPGFWQWVKTTPASELTKRFESVAPPSWF